MLYNRSESDDQDQNLRAMPTTKIKSAKRMGSSPEKRVDFRITSRNQTKKLQDNRKSIAKSSRKYHLADREKSREKERLSLWRNTNANSPAKKQARAPK